MTAEFQVKCLEIQHGFNVRPMLEHSKLYLVLELCRQQQSFLFVLAPTPSSLQSVGREHDECPSLITTSNTARHIHCIIQKL